MPSPATRVLLPRHRRRLPRGRLLAYSVDLTGDERFTLHFMDLSTGEPLPDEIPAVHYGSAWSGDGSTIFYTTVDAAWRPYRVSRHVLGTRTENDVVVHDEPDERFWVGVELTRNEAAILIDVGSKLTSEVWLVDAAAPLGDPVVVAPRREGVEYDVEHAGDRLLIVHNARAEELRARLGSAGHSGHQHWTTVIAVRHVPAARGRRVRRPCGAVTCAATRSASSRCSTGRRTASARPCRSASGRRSTPWPRQQPGVAYVDRTGCRSPRW